MSTLGTAYVQIMPSAEGISGSITSILSGEADRAGSEAGESIGSNLVGALKGIIAAAGIGAAVKAAIGAVDGLASAGDAIDKTSQKMGVSAKQYQAMAFAAEHCGFSTSTFSQAIRKLQSTGYDGTINDYLNGLMAIEDPTERAAKAQEDLGSKVAMEMAAFINGGQTIDDYGAQLEALGGMMSDEAVAASAAYADSLTDMHAAMDGVKQNLLGGLVPTFSTVMQGVAKLVNGDGEGLNMIVGALGDIVKHIIEAVPQMVGAIADLLTQAGQYMLQNLPTFIANGVSLVANIAQGIIKNIPAVAGGIAQVIAKILATIGQNLPSILAKGLELMGQLLAGIIKAIPQIPGYISSIISSIRSAFTGFDWGSIGKNIMTGVANGIKNGASAIVNAAKSAAKSALNAAKSFLGIHSPSRVFRDQVGENIALGWAEGIAEEAGAVENAIGTLSNASVGAIDTNIGLAPSGNDEMYQLLSTWLPRLADMQIVLDDGTLVGKLSNLMNQSFESTRMMQIRGLA